ncbi:MAG TPA: hypothetical protein DCW29_11150, partial [Janthinobacterium sp.]|nr:hypothetical protein [Janthinobacterium sp.]
MVMKYAVLVLTVLAFAAPAHADGNWRNLWRNHEQRGDALLQQGDAAGAAKEYTDPARKGYAELKAGNYAAAAASLAAADDGEANYNRGNALAHAGNLPDAVKAYDAALKRDPHNQDARHNRDLLLKVMQKKPPAQPPKGAPDIKQSGKPGDEKGKDGQAGKPGQDGKQGEPKDGTQAGKQGSAAQGQDGKSGEQKDGSQAGKQGQDGKSGASKNGAQDGKPGQSGASSGKPESAQTQQGGPDEPGSSGQAQSVPPAQTQAGRNA